MTKDLNLIGIEVIYSHNKQERETENIPKINLTGFRKSAEPIQFPFVWKKKTKVYAKQEKTVEKGLCSRVV